MQFEHTFFLNLLFNSCVWNSRLMGYLRDFCHTLQMRIFSSLKILKFSFKYAISIIVFTFGCHLIKIKVCLYYK